MQGPETDMNRESRKIRFVFLAMAWAGLAALGAAPVLAQVPVDESGNPIAPLEGGTAGEEPTILSADALEELVGPVALYPDDLLAIVLPASTYPLQVVQAARFLERLKDDPSLKPDEEWDESVTALLNYPEVVELMNDDIEWTWRLGEAVVAQQADVISAIEAFRDRAYAAGNLKSDEYQTVSNEDGVIEIDTAKDDVIYVPYYEPERVVVYQPRPVYYYHPQPYPVYYYPYPYGYSFASDYFWGVTTAFTIGWLTDHLHVYHHSYWGHPYYGHPYHNRYYYRRPSLAFFNRYYVYGSHRYWDHRYRDGDYWRPRRYGGARPGYERSRAHYYRDRNRDDWRGDRNRHRNDVQAHDRSNRNGTARWRSNREQGRNRDDDRVGRAREDNEARHSGRRARNRDETTDRNAIRFRSRDERARQGADRRRTAISEDRHRRAPTRAGFAASSQTPPAPATRRAEASTPRRHSGSAAPDRIRQARADNSRRHEPPSRPRRSAEPRTTTPRTHVQRAAPPPSAPSRRDARPSPQRHTAAPAAQAERRSSSKRGSRASKKRGENRSRRH